MMRTMLIVLGLLLGLGGVCEAAAKPNVLLLFADDMRADAIAALGNEHIRTPNLDKLVERGVVFNRAYCMGSMSGAVCVPSRAMLNTGRTLWHVDSKIGEHTTLGEHLGRNGYTTFGTGKWHNGAESLLKSFQHGRNIFMGGMHDHFTVPVQSIGPDGKLTPKTPGEGHSSELFADVAVEFLKKQRGEKPFFAYVAFTAPHDPRQSPQKYRDMYDPAKLPLPANYLPEHPFDNGERTIRDEKLLPWPRTKEAVRGELRDYYAMITHMDAQIGRILDALDASGQADNTLIVFAADHGLAIGSHGLLGKQNLYEHSMRAPLIFVGPGVPQGRTDAFVYLLDVFPTICGLTGLETPASVEGKSLVPVIRGQTDRVRDSIFTAYIKVQRAVRDDRWKLIKYNTPGGRHVQLFDLASDPFELHNLAEDSRYAEQVVRLDAMLEQYRDALDDPVEFNAAR